MKGQLSQLEKSYLRQARQQVRQGHNVFEAVPGGMSGLSGMPVFWLEAQCSGIQCHQASASTLLLDVLVDDKSWALKICSTPATLSSHAEAAACHEVVLCPKLVEAFLDCQMRQSNLTANCCTCHACEVMSQRYMQNKDANSVVWEVHSAKIRN